MRHAQLVPGIAEAHKLRRVLRIRDAREIYFQELLELRAVVGRVKDAVDVVEDGFGGKGRKRLKGLKGRPFCPLRPLCPFCDRRRDPCRNYGTRNIKQPYSSYVHTIAV